MSKIWTPSRREFITGAAALAGMAALPKMAGAFPKGAAAAPAPTGPARPPQAATWGYNRLTFFDDFLSSNTIDVNNTLQPGFNWYPKWHLFGTASNYNVWPASCFSVNNSVMTFSPDSQFVTGQGTTGGSITSASFLGTSAPNYVGNLIKPTGMYVETYMQFGATPGLSGNWFPSFWLWDGDIFVYNSPSTPFGGNRYDEIDTVEYNNSQADRGFYDYTVPGAHIGSTNGNFTLSNPTGWHKYGALWVPQSKNNGVGLVQTWIDGVHLPAQDITYTSNSISSVAGSGATTGWGSGLDTSTLGFTLQLQAGYEWPINVDYVQVWQ